mmetsp:Transcript_38370/g.124246  ORF Transcript_38370/g.124246 Transcript_38370/m.124246 type:complete len:211 (+) Transcript_38370:1474-2106(+)
MSAASLASACLAAWSRAVSAYSASRSAPAAFARSLSRAPSRAWSSSICLEAASSEPRLSLERLAASSAAASLAFAASSAALRSSRLSSAPRICARRLSLSAAASLIATRAWATCSCTLSVASATARCSSRRRPTARSAEAMPWRRSALLFCRSSSWLSLCASASCCASSSRLAEAYSLCAREMSSSRFCIAATDISHCSTSSRRSRCSAR